MSRCQGWMLDLYPAAEGMAVWLLGRDGSRRCYWDRNFRPAFCVCGPEATLRQLGESLPARFRGLPHGLQAEHTERIDLWTRSRVPVLAVTPPRLTAFADVVRYVQHAAPHADLYNADLLLEQMYCYERQVFPLALCELEADGDDITALSCLDDPWATQYELPPLRMMEMRPEGTAGNPNHGGGQGDSGRFRVEVRVDGREWLLDEAFAEEPLARSVARLIAQHDPDLILTEWGDAYLLPRLITQAARHRIALPLNRDAARPPFRKRDRSYFSYGRIVFKDSATYLFGRLHVDLRNSFTCGQSGLDGLFELVRLTRLPVQYCARTSTGTGITSMQLDIAWREGILIPSQKAQPEQAKSGVELLVADRGGLVFHPRLGLHENVAELDFASMFPSIMARFNVSPETINCGCCDNALVPELGYAICQKWRGLVSRTVGPIVAKRERYKALLKAATDAGAQKSYDARKTALKWMLVTCFGYQGFKNARFGRIEAHEAINCFGRDRLLMAKDIAEGQGYAVIHALVDSLYLWKAGAVRDDYLRLAAEITGATGLPIDLEGIYKWMIFVPSKTSPGIGVPNRYFGALTDGKLKVRGIAMRRHDCPAIVAAMQQEILNEMSRAADGSEYRQLMNSRGREILETYLARVNDGAVEAAELSISTSLTRAPEQYSHATRAAIAAQSLAARGVHLRPGENVRYVLTDVDAAIPCERARPLQMLEGGLLYDRREYVRLLQQAYSELQWGGEALRQKRRPDARASAKPGRRQSQPDLLP